MVSLVLSFISFPLAGLSVRFLLASLPPGGLAAGVQGQLTYSAAEGCPCQGAVMAGDFPGVQEHWGLPMVGGRSGPGIQGLSHHPSQETLGDSPSHGHWTPLWGRNVISWPMDQAHGGNQGQTQLLLHHHRLGWCLAARPSPAAHGRPPVLACAAPWHSASLFLMVMKLEWLHRFSLIQLVLKIHKVWLEIPLLSSFVTTAAYPTTAVSSCAACLCISPYFCEDTLQAQASSEVLIERWWTNCSLCLSSSLLIVPFFKTTSAHATVAFSFLVISKEKGCTMNPSPLCWLPWVWAASFNL